MKASTVFQEPGAFAGWPANYGIWRFGDELVTVFVVGRVAPADHLHARDMSRPFTPVQLRSTDGGATWRREEFRADLRGATVLSADEHVVPELRAASTVSGVLDPPARPTDFERDSILCARTGLGPGAQSWFYRTSDAARTWEGPFPIPGLGRAGIAARTDIVPLGPRAALWMLSSPGRRGGEGGTICAFTDDGGQSFELRAVVLEEDDDGYAIMPSSARLADGTLISVIRRPNRLESWRSTDDGRTWSVACRDLADTGCHGNPASVVSVPGGLVAVYGKRSEPYRLVARFTEDGASWGQEHILASGIGTPDFGYPASVTLTNGRVLTLYYRADTPAGDRRIDAVTWHPDEVASPVVTRGSALL